MRQGIMKKEKTPTTLIAGLLMTILLWSVQITKADTQSFFRQSGMQLLTTQEGLSNNTITEINQDERGFLWLGTDVGLSRYDGIHFHNYNSADQEPHSIDNIYETSDDILWSRIANQNKLLCFDKMRGRYLPLTSANPNILKTFKTCACWTIKYMPSPRQKEPWN